MNNRYRYRGKKPKTYNSTFWWIVASILTLVLSIVFCFGFIKNLIEWGMCI